MRRLKHGVLGKIVDEFQALSSPLAFVTVEGVDPDYLKKQIARKIKIRKLNGIEVKIIGDMVQLSQTTLPSSDCDELMFKRAPMIRR